ncbi:MAG TPA: hypothetical protein VLB51_03410 [Methylomirabilota bacterium]|nr:hypothetical protein [Methylomirabilota bacterium]
MGRLTSIATWCVVLTTAGLAILAGGAAAVEPDGGTGPDVVVFDLPSAYYWGSAGGTLAYSVGTTSCNRGDEPLEWVSSTNQHPVIAQNLYRVTLPDAGPPVEHGAIEMLGISWLKHGFFSVNGSECGTCQYPPNGGSQLGVGCSDPYSASLNGSQSNLGPRSEVNAFTGYFPEPPGSPSGDPTLAGRINVAAAELVADPTRYRYFVEGQYVAPDDAAAGNGLNNASHREVLVSGSSLTTTGATEEGRPAIYAWQDLDPTVTVREVQVPGEGLFLVAYKVGDNGDGSWRYEYAVFNLNSHLSAAGFSVPILPGSVITGVGFRDVSYHSGEPYDGTDWAVGVDPAAGWLTWSTDSHAVSPLANALRWSTLYNFRFDADSPPQPAIASLAMFRGGGPSSVQVFVEAPAGNVQPLFADDFESGTTGGWSVVVP